MNNIAKRYAPSIVRSTLSATLGLAALLSLTAVPAHATPCPEILSMIDGKIKANGVTAYTLDAIPVTDVTDKKVVGHCEAGTMKIVYQRTNSTALAKATTTSSTTTTASTTTVTAPTTTAVATTTVPMQSSLTSTTDTAGK